VEGEAKKPPDSDRTSGRPSLTPGRGPAHNWRILFAAAWIGLQLTLIVTAGHRYDNAFGFRMFPESSVMTLALYREVEGPNGTRERVHVSDGIWGAKNVDGRVHRFSWYDRVPAPFWVFDREMNASYGASTQLARLQLALDDVATHVNDDAETLRFDLDVTMKRNGREPVVHHLQSRERISTTREEVR
jgi:hypothetical protein